MKQTFSLATLTVVLSAMFVPAQAQVAANAGTHNASTAGASFASGAYLPNKMIGELQLTVSSASVPADGQSAITVELTVIDRKGQLLKGEVFVTLETSAGRLLLNGARTDELGPGKLDADKAVPGTQLKVVDGKASFRMIAPSTPQEGLLRVTAGNVFAERVVSFIPEQRDLMALGLIEGTLALRRVRNESAITGARSNDGFDEALRGFEREFNATSNGNDSKSTTASARAAFFVKGTVTGQTLLTAAYDSDKETRARLLRDVSVDQVYPVFGDASIKATEAKSSQKFYVRLDNGKNYLLYGDFTSADGFSQASGTGSVASVKQRDLGNQSRSLTGVRAHLEADSEGVFKGSFVNLYASKNSLNNIVIERSGSGLSFYQLDHNSAIDNTEKLEVIVRDRNSPGRIISIWTLQRFADYTFEPFNGRIILGAPLQSTDAQGNPQSLRISYEVDRGGSDYWVAGADGQLKINDTVQVGGSFVKNQDPLAPSIAGERKLTQLASVNAGVDIAKNIKVVAEYAQSKNMTSAGEQVGTAVRAELALAKPSDAVSGTVFYAKADKEFYNANASVNLGRQEAGAKVVAKVGDLVILRGEVLASSDETNHASRKGAFLGAEFAITEGISVNAGVRRAKDNGSGLYGPSTIGNANSLFGSGGLFGAATGTGSSNQTAQTGTATGAALDTTTAQLGLKVKLTPTITVGVEGESSLGNQKSSTTSNAVHKANRLAALAEWQVAERTKVSARYETQTGIGSTYDRADKNDAFVLGVTNTYLNSGLGQGAGGAQGELFSEYRLRDSIGGRESQIANGLRNTFDIAQGLRAVAGVEYLKALNGSTQPTLALASGLEYTASELWKSAARIEWRKAQQTQLLPSSTGVMSTLSLARKLDRDWTGLMRNYFATTDAGNVAGKQVQDRFQIGLAYRPVDADRFDMLGKLEYKFENNTESAVAENRKVLTGSVSANWHPSRSWWLSGRVAAKSAYQTDGANNSAGKFTATMFTGRALYDINSRWDIGLMGSVMKGGSMQYAYGLETGFIVRRNLWISLGYNLAGFTDRDLTGNEYTAKGMYIRLRAKFNENLFGGDDTTIITP